MFKESEGSNKKKILIALKELCRRYMSYNKTFHMGGKKKERKLMNTTTAATATSNNNVEKFQAKYLYFQNCHHNKQFMLGCTY